MNGGDISNSTTFMNTEHIYARTTDK